MGFLKEAGKFVGSIIAPQWSANQQNMELSKYQYSKDLEMWNRQNAYNAPVNQMARYAEAGLNPNIVATQGSPGNATEMPRYNSPTVSFDQKIPMVMDILQTFADLGIKQATRDKILEETRAVKDNNDLTAIQKVYWAQNEYNKAIQLYNSGKLTARQFDRAQREFELMFNAYQELKDNGEYEWKFGDTDMFRQRHEAEMSKYSLDAQMENLRITSQEMFNKFFEANQVMRLLGGMFGLFK
jgi:hypothetical protein